MSILGNLLKSLGDGALESAALRQQLHGGGQNPKKGGETCTPCQAMNNVDQHRRRLGYTIK